ncbi:related to Meiotically up-regulated gene 157 protein [Cephalotrichum gorgonifer]|uniref:Related to Meiotically up-regulated gene 157 protein n=1 Tax=Cephalotrichum gorgonifer TaxID=2041049 RepID=A0AAE8MNG0_9PEZI|nr:related to Meiotically up-regulated gene 157 protein [Cephalotrichum gorgonifer]
MSLCIRGPAARVAVLAVFLGTAVLTLFWLRDYGAVQGPAVVFDLPANRGGHDAGVGFYPGDIISNQTPDVPACPNYSSHSRYPHEPLSSGKFALGYQRPSPSCRTFNSTLVEDEIARVKALISDPDVARIFENTFPNTLDTAIKWHGVASNNTEEELSFVITGDIDAMWLRDSANQLQVYRSIITSREDDVAALFRGAINLQARYIVIAPYCNAFQAPPEAGIALGVGSLGSVTSPPIDTSVVSTCNFELDSFAAFLQLSSDYFASTGDLHFFGRFQWIYAVQSMLHAARDMTAPTYDDDGVRLTPPYTFNSWTKTMTATLNNVGTGNPVARTGMVRSPFRPSDDAAVFEFLVPANMMFSRYLNDTAVIMEELAEVELSAEMRDLAASIRAGIEEHAVVEGPGGKKIYAYEVDGFGGRNLMDDANVPSLLSAPFIGYLDAGNEVYRNTREFVLSERNPWYCRGPVINGVGGPHIKPGYAWPMASIIRIMTTEDDAEIEEVLGELVSSTDGLGLMHESINSYRANDWTREWFSWANGLFAQMILDLEARKPHILGKSFQSYGHAEDEDGKELHS